MISLDFCFFWAPGSAGGRGGGRRAAGGLGRAAAGGGRRAADGIFSGLRSVVGFNLFFQYALQALSPY